MVSSYARYIKFREDHGVHELLENKNVYTFCIDYSKFTKYIAKRNKDYFIEDVYLNTKKELNFIKHIIMKKN